LKRGKEKGKKKPEKSARRRAVAAKSAVFN